MTILPSLDAILSEDHTTDPAYDPSLTSPSAFQLSSSLTRTREISLVESGFGLADVPGITFEPRLSVQRIEWILEVLRRERVGSVFDVGCGEGALLEVLCQPANSIREKPIRPRPEDGVGADINVQAGLFIYRLAGLDIDATTLPIAVKATAPPQTPANGGYVPPRYNRLDVEVWQGGLEKHNTRLEGYEAIIGSEIIEHLNGPSLAVFPQMIFGTFKPKIVLITTPNFEFNTKFPHAASLEENCHAHAHGAGRDGMAGGLSKGFLDPTGRTERVFRHSDHKLEMTEAEFREWCEIAEEWGYTAEIGGIGLSNRPSYHDMDATKPIYATHTAIFRQSGAAPHRSPRSVRSVRLPFMPASGEEFHAHRLAVRHVHEPRGAGSALKQGGQLVALSDEEIRDQIRHLFERWNEGEVTFDEIWADEGIAKACAGSKRRMARALGGVGDCPGVSGVVGDQEEWEIVWGQGVAKNLRVRWKAFVDHAEVQRKEDESWGAQEVNMTDASGW